MQSSAAVGAGINAFVEQVIEEIGKPPLIIL
jgi:hypothetical protein